MSDEESTSDAEKMFNRKTHATNHLNNDSTEPPTASSCGNANVVGIRARLKRRIKRPSYLSQYSVALFNERDMDPNTSNSSEDNKDPLIEKPIKVGRHCSEVVETPRGGASAAIASYNAIILDKDKKIIGRTHLTDLSRFPSEKWRVMYKSEIVNSDSQLKNIPSGPGNPFRIMACTNGDLFEEQEKAMDFNSESQMSRVGDISDEKISSVSNNSLMNRVDKSEEIAESCSSLAIREKKAIGVVDSDECVESSSVSEKFCHSEVNPEDERVEITTSSLKSDHDNEPKFKRMPSLRTARRGRGGHRGTPSRNFDYHEATREMAEKWLSDAKARKGQVTGRASSLKDANGENEKEPGQNNQYAHPKPGSPNSNLETSESSECNRRATIRTLQTAKRGFSVRRTSRLSVEDFYWNNFEGTGGPLKDGGWRIRGPGPVRKITNAGGAGPSSCRLKDLEGLRTTKHGHRLPQKAKENWMAFAPGFNVEGKCENRKCISRKSSDLPQPILRFGYGNACLTGNLLNCPACKQRTLKPGTVMVSAARSALNFRVSGVIMGNATLLEHLGTFPEYVTPDEGNDEVDYDIVEIRTVRKHESPFECQSCYLAISLKIDEVRKPCGHNFHKECASNECPICSTDLIADGDGVDNVAG